VKTSCGHPHDNIIPVVLLNILMALRTYKLYELCLNMSSVGVRGKLIYLQTMGYH